MNKYETKGNHFYSELLDVLLMSLGAKGEIGYIMYVIYSNNEAYSKELLDANENFLDDHFVECDFDEENNEISFLGVDDGSTT